MKMRFWRFDLELRHRWTVSSHRRPGEAGGKARQPVVFVELTDADGTRGLGEASPSVRYGESVDTVETFLRRVSPDHLSFGDIPASMAHLGSISPGDFGAKCALNVALVDGAARRSGRRAHAFLGLGFSENRHVTSFSIGLDRPAAIRAKAMQAADHPVLKLKLGSPYDRENLAALRSVAPDKPLRVDANEAWKTKEDALRALEWLAADRRIQFVEQPMPAETPRRELEWLKHRSPLPLYGDESYLHDGHVESCAGAFHGVNVKLVKAGGLIPAREALQAARRAGLSTMLGCMVESSLLISAAAHLAELTDHLDLDGNLLITNDPFVGVQTVGGTLSLLNAPEQTGLCVRARG